MVARSWLLPHGARMGGGDPRKKTPETNFFFGRELGREQTVDGLGKQTPVGSFFRGLGGKGH